MGILKNTMTCLGVLAAVGAGETAYFYRRTMIRNNAKVERTMKMSGTDWSQYAPVLAERKAFMMAQNHRDVYQMSFDKLKLHATYFPEIHNREMENIKEQNVDSQIMENQSSEDQNRTGRKKVAICFHGYTSQGLSDYIGLSDYYLKRGFAMLLPDARAHGQSEGEYIGFGCLDRKDALVWIDWVIQECGEDVEIILHGTSMGGATVLMASGLDLPKQVKGIVSDCGFTSPKEVFTHVLNSMYHLPAFPAIQGADIINKKLAGYGMDECNAKQEVRKAKVPILFIHGANDTFVPCKMCHEIYDYCAAPKKKLIVEGAAHAESYYKDMEKYEQALTEFFEEIL